MNNTERAKLSEVGRELVRKANKVLIQWAGLYSRKWMGKRGGTDVQVLQDITKALLIQRAEISALVNLLTTSGAMQPHAYLMQVAHESNHLTKQMEQEFPGFMATEAGMMADSRAAETEKDWPA